MDRRARRPRACRPTRGRSPRSKRCSQRYRAPTQAELPPFHGGIVGWIGYDTVREIERLPDVPPDDLGLPDAVCSLAGQVAAFDHFRQRCFLIENVYPPPDATTPRCTRCTTPRSNVCTPRSPSSGRPLPYLPAVPPPDELTELPEVRTNLSEADWARAVEAAKEHILDGDIFQVVLAQRFDLVEPVDPWSVYRVLRLVNPSPYMYFLRHPEATIVGSSPEPMVQVVGDRVISRPIAGTRRRGRTPEHDRRMEAELVEHPKERAEHVMLVDLARNDVGRVVQFGTERVEELMTLERYSHVMHLTSQVAGTIAPGRGPIDVLRATFPAGTVSGAPKVRAMEIIDELEPTKRGPYAGVVGYVDFSGNLDTADRDPHDGVARRPGDAPGGRGDRRRLRPGRRGAGMPQQGAGVAHRGRRSRAARPERELIAWPRLSFARIERDLVVVSGPDATTFLQSLLSQDLDPVAVGETVHSLFLEPRGKLVADLRVKRVAGDEWWCVCESGVGSALASGLNRFKIRVKVEIEERPVVALAVRGARCARGRPRG